MKKEQINERVRERDSLYMRDVQELPEYEKGNRGFQDLKIWVENQPWYKEKIDDRHYTEEHRLQRCTCWSPDQWPKEYEQETQER